MRIIPLQISDQCKSRLLYGIPAEDTELLKLAVGDATETVAAVKSAASSEIDCVAIRST